MITFPNAKINIGLKVLSKRNDGFHNIETIFYPINLKEIIEFVPSKTNEFAISGLEIKADENNNLIIKAYNLLKENYKLPNLKIHLHKIIPTEAGLGGGSADATFMLIALNEYFTLNITEAELLQYAEKLGSDCPVFVRNKPFCATEKGEVLEEIELSLKGYYIVVIKPDIQIATADAYKNVKFSKSNVLLKDAIKEPIDNWKNSVFNDFEEYAFSIYPELKEIKAYLYNIGAEFALITGSGSAIYGIFKEKPQINKYKDCFVWIAELG